MKLIFSIVLLFAALDISRVAHSQDSEPVMAIKIKNESETRTVDIVDLGDGTKALRTSGLVQIEQLFGSDPQGTTWAYIGTADDANGVGAAGDIITTTIGEAASPLNLLYPAISVDTTVTIGIATADNPERELAEQICTDLVNDVDFNVAWDCIVIKDFSGVFIASKFFNEFGERKNCVPETDCFNMTSTGTTIINPAFFNIERRGLGTELARSPNDPRQGILSISGTVIEIPGGAGDLLFEEFMNNGSADFRVDGSITPVNFRIECDSFADKYINEIRQYLGCNGLKFGQWTCKNGNGLPNGVQVTIRSEADDLLLLPIKTTEDFKNKFAIGQAGPGSLFRIDIQAGGDQLVASFALPQPAILKRCGTNGTGIDDYIELKIQDDLTSGTLAEYSGLISGFLRVP